MKKATAIRSALVLLAAVSMAVAVSSLPAAAATVPPRVDLNVLVVTDGSPWVEAIHQQLNAEGVATTVVDLNNASRPVITGSFLSGTLPDGTPHAFFQGVVLPNDAPSGLATGEMSALAAFEQSFSVRQVDSYVYPTPNVGTNYPTFAGSLDASRATVTLAAKAAGFGYLNGTFNFEGTAGGTESYGYLTQPLANTATTSFTPFLTETIPGTSTTGTLAGVYNNAGQQQLEISFGFNYYQLQFRYIAHGIVDWITHGVHFGYWRNWFDVHIDDVFNADAIWSTVGDCTPGDGACPAGTPDTTPARMTSDDVLYAYNWELQNNFTLDMLFNGGAESQFQVNGLDPMFTTFQALASGFRWVNHTYTHQFLGCVQDFTVIPWQCSRDSNGNIVWVDTNTINSEILKNVQWANNNGFPINRGEMVAGEHSGTLILPQQPVDNPNFDNALGPDRIQVTGLDASREPVLRPVGAAMGFPRHPINVFYNVSTQTEEISEYNWIYTSTANGGSGLCQNSTTTSCIQPLGPDGWTSYILPLQTQITLGYVLQDDPRVFYMHQSNLTGDRLAYPVISGVLNAYRSVYAPSTPVVNGRFLDAAKALSNQQNWRAIAGNGTVTGYVQGTSVVITGPAGTVVPVTAPNQTKQGFSSFGSSYANERSAFVALGSSALVLTLPSVAYPGQ